MAAENPKKAVPGQDFEPDKSNLQKNPDDWVTADEPMTDAQASYLKTLTEEANEEFSTELTKAEASKRIDELRQKTGRGMDNSRQETRKSKR